MRTKIEGRIEENEENKSLNDKNYFEDQFTTFISLDWELTSEGEEHHEEKSSKGRKGRTRGQRNARISKERLYQAGSS